jgi:hypothetical protein
MSYPGSKAQAGVFQTVIGQMPPHSVYVEPFFGSGQIFWHKRRAISSIVFDLAPDLLAKAGAEKGVIAEPGNALKLLPGLALWLPSDAVIYCDPPYLLGTRGRPGRVYYNDLLAVGAREMSDQEHAQLLALLKGIHCRILISGYPSELYSSELTGWRCVEYRTRTRGKTVTECLWCNFPEPEQLHDWRFAGRNFRERWRLTKLKRRTLAKLEAMNARERGYVLDAISQRQNWREDPEKQPVPAMALSAARAVTAKVSADNGGFIGKCFIGNLPVFKTGPRETEMQAMLDVQDWADRQGKLPHFERL